MANEDFEKSITQTCNRKPHVLNDIISSSPVFFKYSITSSIGKSIDYVVERMMPFGIPQYWYSYYQWYKYVKDRVMDENDGPRVFALIDLWHGFIIWLAACLFSTVGFIIEWVLMLTFKLIKLITNLVRGRSARCRNQTRHDFRKVLRTMSSQKFSKEKTIPWNKGEVYKIKKRTESEDKFKVKNEKIKRSSKNQKSLQISEISHH
jgi:hypothetical protein